MKRILPIALVMIVVAACAESSTSPAPRKALRDCTEIVFETCGIPPHIDSISPNESAYTQMDMNGNPISGQFGPFVCVYGSHLDGGSVFYNGTYQSTSNSGCGALVFSAPVTAPGQFSVTVVTDYGESNAVTFTRH